MALRAVPLLRDRTRRRAQLSASHAPGRAARVLDHHYAAAGSCSLLGGGALPCLGVWMPSSAFPSLCSLRLSESCGRPARVWTSSHAGRSTAAARRLIDRFDPPGMWAALLFCCCSGFACCRRVGAGGVRASSVRCQESLPRYLDPLCSIQWCAVRAPSWDRRRARLRIWILLEHACTYCFCCCARLCATKGPGVRIESRHRGPSNRGSKPTAHTL